MDGAEVPPGNRRAQSSTLATLLGILLLSFALRLFHSATLPLRADEAANYYLAIEQPAAIIRTLLSADPHLPVFYLLIHFWMMLAGASELSLRFPSIFASVLVVPLVYLFARRLFPRSAIATAAAFLVAINPYSIWDAQDAYMYSMLTASGLASFITFDRVMRPRPARLAWLAYVASSGLTLYIHYLGALVLVAQAALWLFWTARRTVPRSASLAWIAAQAVIAALLAPWIFLALPFLSGLKENLWRPVGLLELLVRSTTAFSVGRIDSSIMPATVNPQVGLAGALLLFAFAIVGMALERNPRIVDTRQRLLLICYLWVPLFAFFVFTAVRFPVFDERYVLFLVPPFIVLVGRGIVVIQERFRRPQVAGIALVLAAIVSGLSLFNYWYLPAYAKSPDWPEFVRQLTTEYRPGDLLIQNYPDSALPYYLNSRVPSVLVPGRATADAASVSARLLKLSSTYRRVWFQPAAGGNWDTSGIVATWLDRHAKLVRSYSFRGIDLELYLPAATALAEAAGSVTSFESGIQLLGFDLSVGGEAGTVSKAEVVLYWQSTGPTARDLTAFLHLYDRKGVLVSQEDGQPVHGTFPTHDWVKGETVVDSRELPIPAGLAAGEYAVVVGLYDSETKARIPIVNSQSTIMQDNRALLTNLDLK